jgi:hypothetical protein
MASLITESSTEPHVYVEAENSLENAPVVSVQHYYWLFNTLKISLNPLELCLEK